MLVISRRAGKSVVIGDNICVTVLSVTGKTVRLGIAAPRATPVHRQEVHERDLLAQSSRALPEPLRADDAFCLQESGTAV